MDHNATTPVDRRVLDVMMPYFMDSFGNAASSSHIFGQIAEASVQNSREEVANLIGAFPEDIIFTSGATESDNMAIKGVAYSYSHKGNHIVTCKTEHKAVLDTCKALEKDGFEVTYLPVDKYGMVDPDDVSQAIKNDTILITIMYINSEIGTKHPVPEIGRIAQERGILFHCDAVQAVGKIPCSVDELCLDMMSISGHKIYGPKGVGALYIRKRRPRIRLKPLIDGGGHEKNLRSGTLNVSGIVGLGAACNVCGQEMEEEATRLTYLRDKLYRGITEGVEYVYLNGHPRERLPGNLNLSFEFIEGESLLLSLKDIAISSGSACTSKDPEPSYVLTAMGIDPALAYTSIRFGLGRYNTEEEVDFVTESVIENVHKLREMSPLYRMKVQGIELNKVDDPSGFVEV